MPEGRREGPLFWRSLEERAGTAEFQQLLRREFPDEPWSGAPELDRRRFLQLMAASLALGGLAACTRQPPERIVPWVRPPEEVIPGRPLWFATAATHEGAATGLLVESHLGRPTKIEGNPDHPASLGAASALDQAAVLSLYDPDRSRAPLRLGEIRTWPDLRHELDGVRESQGRTAGAGLRVLTGSVLSPTLASQLDALLDRFPKAKLHQWEPSGRANAREGARLAFGRPAETRYDVAIADVVLTIEGDLLSHGPGSLRYAREFARRRQLEEGAAEWNRLYAVESTPTDTGTLADHRFPLRPREVVAFTLALAARLGVLERAAAPDAPFAPWLDPLARDLRAHAGRSLIHAGDPLPPALHALVHAMNAALGTAGTAVIHTEPVVARPVDPLASLRELVADLESGAVETLLILGTNPVFTAPPDLKLVEALRRAPLRLHVGLHADETAEHCHWHVPEAHFLESWSDARAFDGTATIVQPLIEPLFGARSVHEVVGLLLGETDPSAYETVRAFWRKRLGEGADFETLWRKSLRDGVVPGTAFPGLPLRPDADAVARAARDLASSSAPEAGTLELALFPDPTIGDGRFANNAWLQELPKPLTKLAWDNAALLSPATAARLGLRNEDVVELTRAGARVTAPVWIVPGLAQETVTVHFGPGRRRAGRVGNGAGFDAYPLRTSDALAGPSSVRVRKTGGRFPLACTQGHFQMEGRDLVRVLPLGESRRAAPAPEGGPPSLYPPRESPGPAWGMSIDLGACTGCSACVVACQAENNIPTVGKAEVLRHREMHWLRIDRWYQGDPERPRILHQPVPCMHCEQAPCEPVCPVAATTHSPDGLNEMTYNRCVGTRYCSNNCPYKVRRFNFFPFAQSAEPLARLLQNPDVTVRGRGVMEKCTYCVQRIRQAGIDAEREGRALRDGDVVTACQQSCPTGAIVFGDLKLLASRVARRRASARSYALLGELGTRPRTTYLARAVHPNPELGA